MLYTRSFYALSHYFHSLRLSPKLKPAVGALATGAVGLLLFYLAGERQQVLAVLSFGYGSLQEALTLSARDADDLALAAVFLAIALGKILTTGLTIGSGSGGVFGPSMVIGGCGGGALGIALHHLSPGLAPFSRSRPRLLCEAFSISRAPRMPDCLRQRQQPRAGSENASAHARNLSRKSAKVAAERVTWADRRRAVSKFPT
jgi:hypothetical protein